VWIKNLDKTPIEIEFEFYHITNFMHTLKSGLAGSFWDNVHFNKLYALFLKDVGKLLE
jgi:hypothetical protein